MASKIAENKNQVKCPKCSGDLKNPTLLACRHILCKICINDLNPNDSQENYGCSLCKSVTPKTQAKNLTVVQELLEFIETVGSKDCGNCKQNPCEWRCKECKFSFCTECRRNHDSLEVLKNHSWSKIQEDAQPVFENCLFCEEHPNEPVRIYCVKKHQLGCALCATTPDQDNNFKKLEDAVETVIPAIKENQMKLENEIQTAEKRLAENVATAEEIKDACEKLEEQIEDQYKGVLEKNETNFKGQLQQATDEYEDDLKKAKQKYEDTLEKAIKCHEEITKKAKEECTKLKKDLNKTRRDQLRVIEQDNCSLELEIRSGKSVVGLCETSLSVAQGATLLSVMRSGLSTSLELHLQRKPVYKKYSNAPMSIFVASDIDLSKSSETSLVGELFSHSTLILRPLEEISNFSTKLALAVKTDFNCTRFDFMTNQLWCADFDSNQIHIYSLNGEKINCHTISEAEKCYSVVRVKETSAAVAAKNGLFLLNTDGEITKILPGDFGDVSVIGDNMYALEYGEGIIHVLQQQSENHYVEFKQFKIEDYSSSWHNTIQATPKYVYIGISGKHCIAQYLRTGDLVAIFEETDGSPLGQLSYPCICGADATGTILIADYGNDRLVTLTPEGKFARIKQNGLGRKPQSAVVTNNRLYVFCWGDFNNKGSFQIFSQV